MRVPTYIGVWCVGFVVVVPKGTGVWYNVLEVLWLFELVVDDIDGDVLAVLGFAGVASEVEVEVLDVVWAGLVVVGRAFVVLLISAVDIVELVAVAFVVIGSLSVLRVFSVSLF